MRLIRNSQRAWPTTWPSPPPKASSNTAEPKNEVPEKSKLKELWPLMALWLFIAIFTVLYSVYIYKSLLSPDPAIGNLLPSASDTNLVVSVLSQVLANSVDVLLTGVFDVLRWQLASRLAGISATTFFQLSSSTQWIALLCLTITKFSSSGVGLIRLLLPLFGLYFGSILKYRAEFVYYFKESAERTAAFAGSGVPLDELVLALIPASYIGIFFMSWIPTLLDVPKYAVSMPLEGCEQNCTSSFLPGGIETARKLGPYLNMTLLEGGVFRNSETIQIHNAPGILLRFDNLPPTFDFDRTQECHTYGQHLNDTLQVCIRQVNGSLAVGWAACPTALYRTSSCTTNTSWLAAPLPKVLLMTRYKQYATTAYSGLDFSILNVSPTSPPTPEPLNASTYLATWSKIFQPPPPPPPPPPGPSPTSLDNDNPDQTQTQTRTQTDNDQAMTSALTYAVTWLLRLYDDVFPDDTHTPLSHLRNFLAIPQQFMVTCLQFANYSVPPELSAQLAGRFALPPDMQTEAVRGTSTTRFLAVGWVVWVYIASAGGVVVAVGGVVVGMAVRREGVPSSTGFVEVDLAARFQDTRESREDDDVDGLAVIRQLGRAREVSAAVTSSFGVARELKRRRIRVVSVSDGERRGGGDFAGMGRYELFAFQEEHGDRTRVRLARMDTEETRVASPQTKRSW